MLNRMIFVISFIVLISLSVNCSGHKMREKQRDREILQAFTDLESDDDQMRVGAIYTLSILNGDSTDSLSDDARQKLNKLPSIYARIVADSGEPQAVRIAVLRSLPRQLGADMGRISNEFAKARTDPDPLVRREAWSTFKITDGTVAQFEPGFKDTDIRVRERAAYHLGLLVWLQNSEAVRNRALDAYLPQLEELLTADDLNARSAAAFALAVLHYDLQPLDEYLADAIQGSAYWDDVINYVHPVEKNIYPKTINTMLEMLSIESGGIEIDEALSSWNQKDDLIEYLENICPDSPYLLELRKLNPVSVDLYGVFPKSLPFEEKNSYARAAWNYRLICNLADGSTEMLIPMYVWSYRNRVRQRLIKRLPLFSDNERVVDALIVYLSVAEPALIRAAASSLSSIGTPAVKSIPIISELMLNNDSQRLGLGYSLAAFGPEYAHLTLPVLIEAYVKRINTTSAMNGIKLLGPAAAEVQDIFWKEFEESEQGKGSSVADVLALICSEDDDYLEKLGRLILGFAMGEELNMAVYGQDFEFLRVLIKMDIPADFVPHYLNRGVSGAVEAFGDMYKEEFTSLLLESFYDPEEHIRWNAVRFTQRASSSFDILIEALEGIRMSDDSERVRGAAEYGIGVLEKRKKSFADLRG